MELGRYLKGELEAGELKRYVIVQGCISWGLIFLAWVMYPAENHYSIMSHTFSFLGSWEAKHNPQWWWLFSSGMLCWSLSTLPLLLYLNRRFALISPWAAAIGTVLFFLGCMCTAGVALFPDAHGIVIGDLEWTDIHEKVAISVAIFFTLGILWHGALLLWDRFAGLGIWSLFQHSRFIWPYALWSSVLGLGIYYLTTWDQIYAARKAAARAAGVAIGSSWAESINTKYAFPLWENLVIYTLFIFLTWVILTVPNDISSSGGNR